MNGRVRQVRADAPWDDRRRTSSIRPRHSGAGPARACRVNIDGSLATGTLHGRPGQLRWRGQGDALAGRIDQLAIRHGWRKAPPYPDQWRILSRIVAIPSVGSLSLEDVDLDAIAAQGSSLFQDAQSGEESTDLRCVSAKCLRAVGYAPGRSKPIVAFRKAAITSGPERLRIRLASSPIVTSRT